MKVEKFIHIELTEEEQAILEKAQEILSGIENEMPCGSSNQCGNCYLYNHYERNTCPIRNNDFVELCNALADDN